MITFIFWVLGIINAVVWAFNLFIHLQPDPSGRGMVLMVTVPFGIIVSLVSLVIVGFLT